MADIVTAVVKQLQPLSVSVEARPITQTALLLVQPVPRQFDKVNVDMDCIWTEIGMVLDASKTAFLARRSPLNDHLMYGRQRRNVTVEQLSVMLAEPVIVIL